MAKEESIPAVKGANAAIHTREAAAAYVRFSVAQRVEHIVLLVSFTTLALTGLPQKFAGNSIAEWAMAVFGGIETTRVIHHGAAITFIVMSIYHVVVLMYKIFVMHTELSMLPGLRDLTDAIGIVGYNLGLSKERPLLPRYGFDEKAEYWAMVWGTVVMALTGFMLWNPILFTKFLPGEIVPAAKAAHGAEAVLAVLAIIVWHFYNVHLKEWNASMWTGKMSEHAMAHEHGEELAQIKSGRLRPRPAAPVIAKRVRSYVPAAAVVAIVMLGGVYWLATAEQTAITTVPTPPVKVFVPLPPTLAPAAAAAQIGPFIPHPVTAAQQQCDTCHGPTAAKPYPADHAGRPNVSCLVCHSTNPAAAVAKTPAPAQAASTQPSAILHAVQGREDCLMCHKTDGLQPAPADHAGRGNDTCTMCHKPAGAQTNVSAGPTSAVTPAAGGPAPIPHDLAGKEKCETCHGGAGTVKPVPADHAGRTVDTCTMCHKPAAGVSASGTAAPKPAASTVVTGTTGTPAVSGPAPILHSLEGKDNCVMCHAVDSAIQPAPADHAGRANDTCQACHKPATAAGATPGTAASSAAAPAVIPADHAGRPTDQCVMCHAPDSSIKPAPADHAGRTGDTCQACHKPQ